MLVSKPRLTIGDSAPYPWILPLPGMPMRVRLEAEFAATNKCRVAAAGAALRGVRELGHPAARDAPGSRTRGAPVGGRQIEQRRATLP